MNRKQAILWIGIFIIITVLLPVSLLLTNLLSDRTNTENQEYRELAAMPSLTDTGLDELFPQLENYINDHVPFRTQIIKGINLLKMNGLHSSASEQVVCGKDGWMYLAESVDWYRGERLFSQEELDIIIEKLLFLTHKMENAGSQFVLFIAPDKTSVYPEFLPSTIGEKRFNKTEQLIAALEENHIHYVFPADSLIAQKETMQLYAKRDTHWNALGAYIGAYELNKYINTPIPSIDELDIYPKEFDSEDLSRMMNLAGYWGTEEDYDFVGYAPGCVINMVNRDHTGNSIWYQTTGAAQRKVYFLRDSFGHRMIPFMAAGASDFCVRHIELFYPESIDEEAPDYLILELTERRLAEILQHAYQ